MASVLLKQYIKAHWDHQDEHFVSPEINSVDKQAMKELLPRGLSDPVSKIRTAIVCISVYIILSLYNVHLTFYHLLIISLH